METQQQHDKDEKHGNPLQHVEVIIHLEQRVGSIVISIEHQQIGVAGNGITDTDIVALAAAHGVVGTAYRGKAKIIVAIRMFHQRRLITCGNQPCGIERVWLVVAGSRFEESIEGLGSKVGLWCRLRYQHAHLAEPIRCPVILPCIDALLLNMHGNENLIGMSIVLDKTELLQRIELTVKDGEMADGLLHRLAFTGKVFRLVAGIGLAAKQIFRVFSHRVLIAQIMHVGIETNAAHKVGTDTNDYHQTNNGQQGLVAVKGIAVDSLDKGRETFSL